MCYRTLYNDDEILFKKGIKNQLLTKKDFRSIAITRWTILESYGIVEAKSFKRNTNPYNYTTSNSHLDIYNNTFHGTLHLLSCISYNVANRGNRFINSVASTTEREKPVSSSYLQSRALLEKSILIERPRGKEEANLIVDVLNRIWHIEPHSRPLLANRFRQLAGWPKVAHFVVSVFSSQLNSC